MKTYLAISYILFILAITLPSYASSASNLAAIVGVVNNDIITNNDIKQRMNFIIKANNLDPLTPGLKQQILKNLIDEKLFIQEAAKLQINLAHNEILYAMEAVAKHNNMSLIEFKASLEADGVVFTEFEKQLEVQMLWNKIIAIYIEPNTYVTENEIRENNAIIKNRGDDMYELAEITIYNNDADTSTLELLNNLTTQINQGKDFAKIAKDFSNSAAAQNGGYIGWIDKANLSDIILKGIQNLKEGDVSEPLITPDSIKIIKLIGKKNTAMTDSKATIKQRNEDTVRKKKLDSRVRNYLYKIRKDAFIEIKQYDTK